MNRFKGSNRPMMGIEMQVGSGVPDRQRRRLVAGGAAALAWGAVGQPLAMAQAVPAVGASGARVALLIGNREYLANQDLPPMHTNVRRLASALEALGFQVTAQVDQSREESLRAVEAFGRTVAALPPDGVSLFYFCGHGMQIDAENFLLPARVSPKFLPLNQSLSDYLALRARVLASWPVRPVGQSITVVDACRASVKPLEAVKDDGLNQVRVREGEMVVFSTSAGKPALSPISPDRMTFFTDELVRQLERQAMEPEELNFRELFRSVGLKVTETMRTHEVEDIRELAQIPYLADNVRQSSRVSIRPPSTVVAVAPSPAAPQVPKEDPVIEERAFAGIGEALWPAEAGRRARAFLERYPQSRFHTAATVAAAGASESALRLRQGQAELFQRDFSARPELGEAFNEDLRRAAVGDKEAAARVAQQLLARGSGAMARSYVAWMQFSAELGNGIAAYDLSRYFADNGQGAESGRWETLARQLGYVPPPRLRNVR